jgi:hypothetical protein
LRQSLEDVQRKELNDCRAEITALKMYIEGTQSSKQLFVGTSDGVKSHSIANSVGASSLNNEDEDSKGSEAVTNRRASAVNITDDTQKDRQVLESVEGSSISETPVSFTTDENGSYGTSEEDKSVSNISSNNVCFQSNLHGASMTGKSQGSSDGISMYLSIEKLESPSKQKCSDKMVSVLIYSALCIKQARLLLLILIAIPIFIPVGFGDYKDSFRCTSKDCSLCAHKPS